MTYRPSITYNQSSNTQDYILKKTHTITNHIFFSKLHILVHKIENSYIIYDSIISYDSTLITYNYISTYLTHNISKQFPNGILKMMDIENYLDRA